MDKLEVDLIGSVEKSKVLNWPNGICPGKYSLSENQYDKIPSKNLYW